tara:strand:- start:6867 stop:7109 length:243 start_codon:yes stop_codon:yes gene_type:complete
MVTKAEIKSIEVGADDTIVIVKDFEGKARREGTKAAKIFDSYKDGQTVAEFLAKSREVGGSLRNVRKDVAYGRIELKKAA